MAYTSILAVHRLDRSVEYVMDKEKTSRTGAGSAASSLEEAVDYARDREKTECGVFESAIGCTLETAYRDMRANKERWGQMDGVQGYHLVQSFAEGELTPELAHRIGLELAERLLNYILKNDKTSNRKELIFYKHIFFLKKKTGPLL